MILYFRSGADHLNVCFEKKNYNCNTYPEGNYIDVDPDALDAIYREVLSNNFDCVDNLKADYYQKKFVEYDKKKIDEIFERINNGELLAIHHVIRENGRSYPSHPRQQRFLLYATMLAYPEYNNSEIARITGASRGTVIKCRKTLEKMFNDEKSTD